MQRATRLSADQREDLVAYLDGELEDGATQAIDQVLSGNEVARHEVEALARTWELLDLLPKPNASTTFTERTMTTLKVSEVRKNVTDQPWYATVRKGGVAVVWTIVLAAAGVLGYTATANWVPNPNEQLLDDLPLLQNLNLYLAADSLAFVSELERAVDLSVSGGGEPARALEQVPPPAPGVSVKQAQFEQAAKLTVQERELVQRNRATWSQLPPERQAALRAVHAELQQAPRNVKTTLETYYTWLQTLSPGQREDLRRASDSAARIDLIRQYKEAQDATRETQLFELNLDPQRMRRDLPPPPYFTPEELQAMTDYLAESLRPVDKNELSRADMLPVEKSAYVLKRSIERTGDMLKWPDEESLAALVDLITQEQLQRGIRNLEVPLQRNAVKHLLAKSLQAQLVGELARFAPKEEQLRDVFVKQSGAAREELMQLPPRELTQRLVDEYLKTLEDPVFLRLRRLSSQFLMISRETMPMNGPRPPRLLDRMKEWGGNPPFFGPRPPNGERPPNREPPPAGDGPPRERPRDERPNEGKRDEARNEGREPKPRPNND